MKKFLSVALMMIVMCVCGCGSKYSDETLIVDFAFWTEDKENINDMLDAINTYDTEFLAQQVVGGKVKHAEKETKIAVISELNNGEIVEIKFLQGRYKNKIGYTLSECIKDVGKEKEIKKKQDEERRAKESKQLEDQAKREQKEKEYIEQLAADKQSSDGVQVVVALGDGTNAYQKLLGKTNLPEGTRLSITLAGVKKETFVQNDGTFSALFERSIVPVGEQNISITTLEGKQIYSGTIQVQ